MPELSVVHAPPIGLAGASDAEIVQYCLDNGLYLLTANSYRVNPQYDLQPFVQQGVGVVAVRFTGSPVDTLAFYRRHCEWLLSLCGEANPNPFGYYVTRSSRRQLY